MTVEWQYNGAAPMYTIISWCDNSLEPADWSYNGWETIMFYTDAAWTFFRLRWL